jgi:hypothetical protein
MGASYSTAMPLLAMAMPKARVEPRSGFVAVDRFNWPTEHVVEVAAVGQHSWIVLVGPPEVLESPINGIYSASISGVM